MIKQKKNEKPLGFGETVLLSDYEVEADKALASFGRTDLYSTGSPGLDEWMGHGGFGRKDGYELMLIYGKSGVGKSSIAVRLLMNSVRQHIEQAWLILEDSPADTLNRLCAMTGDREQTMKDVSCIHLMADTMLENGFRLDNIIDWIQSQSDRGIKLFLIDHLQFAFENADDIMEKNENLNQRIFMKKLNFLAKKNNLTIVMISHVNKMSKAEGMDKVIGSSAIIQASTKVIEAFARKDGSLGLYMWKSRFTELNYSTAAFTRKDMHYEFSVTLPGYDTEANIQTDNGVPLFREPANGRV